MEEKDSWESYMLHYDSLNHHPQYIDWLKEHHTELYMKIIRNNKIEEILKD